MLPDKPMKSMSRSLLYAQNVGTNSGQRGVVRSWRAPRKLSDSQVTHLGLIPGSSTWILCNHRQVLYPCLSQITYLLNGDTMIPSSQAC